MDVCEKIGLMTKMTEKRKNNVLLHVMEGHGGVSKWKILHALKHKEDIITQKAHSLSASCKKWKNSLHSDMGDVQFNYGIFLHLNVQHKER